MKKLLALLALVGLCAVASAQVYSPVYLINQGASGIVTANTTSNYSTAAFTADVRKQRTLGILLSWKLTGSGTDNNVFTFERSIDNSTYDATQTFAVTAANNGTTTVTIGTNITLNGFGWIRLKSIQNGDANDVLTNLVVQYAIKQAD